MLTEETQIQGKVGVDRRHRGAEEPGRLITKGSDKLIRGTG